jgi:hypothetical protein
LLGERGLWDGEPIGTGRKIYPEFAHEIHVKEFDWNYVRDNGNFYMGMDPAAHYYPACVWLAEIPHPDNKKRFDTLGLR